MRRCDNPTYSKGQNQRCPCAECRSLAQAYQRERYALKGRRRPAGQKNTPPPASNPETRGRWSPYGQARHPFEETQRLEDWVFG